MERIKRFIEAVKALFSPRPRGVILRPMPPQPRPAGGGRAVPPANPAARAFQNIFAPRHADERQLAYRPVPPDGVVVEQTEEWFREGNTMRSRTQRSLVITVSGAVVPADQLRGKCICGGFDNTLHHCAQCGRGLCKLCVRRFRLPDGREIILCERDLRAATDAFDTWRLRQRRNP